MFKSEYDDNNKICTIYLEGVISLKSAIQLKEQIAKEADNGYPHIILDFSNNVHVDSSGIGAIFNSQKFLNERSGTLKIKNLGHETLSILKIANLDKHLNII
ncbi:MAG: STAS domain-containing protein [Leptospiraceae bacterium]|nr:STAS domain-containing protein [Leptospiraceae bacterium]MCP5511263.1 STAS domain-containing protein [Leptospiraceae bacterium]